MCSAPVDDKNTVRFGITCCQHDSILCIPGIRPFILHKKIRRLAEHPTATAATSRLLRFQRNDMRKASQGKSGAISHRVKKTPPSGGTSRRDSGYLTHVARSAQQYAQQPDELISGAISHSRACFAEESARGVYLRTRPERRRLQGALRQSEIAPCTKKISGIVLLSHSQIYSTIAAGALNHRVREGNVCFCSAIDTGNIISISQKNFRTIRKKNLHLVRIK